MNSVIILIKVTWRYFCYLQNTIYKFNNFVKFKTYLLSSIINNYLCYLLYLYIIFFVLHYIILVCITLYYIVLYYWRNLKILKSESNASAITKWCDLAASPDVKRLDESLGFLIWLVLEVHTNFVSVSNEPRPSKANRADRQRRCEDYSLLVKCVLRLQIN